MPSCPPTWCLGISGVCGLHWGECLRSPSTFSREASLCVSFLNCQSERDISPNWRDTWDIVRHLWWLESSQMPAEQPLLHLPQVLLTTVYSAFFPSAVVLCCASEPAGGLVKADCWTPAPKLLRHEIGVGPGICTSCQTTGDAAYASLGIPLWEPLPYNFSREAGNKAGISPYSSISSTWTGELEATPKCLLRQKRNGFLIHWLFSEKWKRCSVPRVARMSQDWYKIEVALKQRLLTVKLVFGIESLVSSLTLSTQMTSVWSCLFLFTLLFIFFFQRHA